HHCELKRVGENIALADDRVERVGGGPFAAIFAHLPVAVGNRAIALVAARKLIFLTQAEQPRGRGNRVIAEAVTEPVEIAVAALFDRGLHVDRAVGAKTSKETAAKPVSTNTGVPLAR